jgi:hypothetical protein
MAFAKIKSKIFAINLKPFKNAALSMQTLAAPNLFL